jgi:hypothetical protein
MITSDHPPLREAVGGRGSISHTDVCGDCFSGAGDLSVIVLSLNITSLCPLKVNIL